MTSKLHPAAAVAVLALIAAGIYWWTESGAATGVRYVAMLLGTLVVVVTFGVLALRRWTERAVALLVFIPLTIAGWWIGGNVYVDAFGECVINGKRVQQQLVQFRSETGRFPMRLSELGPQVCGRRHLHGSVLRYARTPSGYRITLEDSMRTYEGSETQAFTMTR